MAMNRVQFQPGLSLPAFLQRYGKQAQCQQALQPSRWPQGFACPRCQSTQHSKFHRHGPLLAVFGLPPSGQPALGHGVRQHQAAANHVVAGAGRTRPCAHRHRQPWSCWLRTGARPLGEHRAEQSKAIARRHPSRLRLLQVRASHSGRGGVAVQSPVRSRRPGAASTGRRSDNQAMVGTAAAGCAGLCQLKVRANQVPFRLSSFTPIMR